MSYKCASCHSTIPIHIPSVLLILGTREKTYRNIDGEIEGKGSEFTRTAKVCHPCVGLKTPPIRASVPLNAGISAMAEIARTHAGKCKKGLDDCDTCKGFVRFFANQRLDHLAKLCEEKPAPKLRISMALVAVENLIDRTTDESKRAAKDSAAAMFYLKGYEQRGGGL